MRNALRTATLACALVLALAAPLSAAQPEKISKPFDVKLSGGVVDVYFTLTMSEVTNYPVTITAISGSTEEVLFEGQLAEGVYRLSAPLSRISGRGDLKVVLKTRITNRTEKGGEAYNVYQRWQGPM